MLRTYTTLNLRKNDFYDIYKIKYFLSVNIKNIASTDMCA